MTQAILNPPLHTSALLPEEQIGLQQEEIAQLKRQLCWFKKQLFNRKSEWHTLDSPDQPTLTGLLGEPVVPLPVAEKQTITYQCSIAKKQCVEHCVTDSSLCFGLGVSVTVIAIPELSGPDADQYELVDIRKIYRLSQHSAGYEVMCFERPVLKDKETHALYTVSGPWNMLGNSLANVSFLNGTLIEKFLYRLANKSDFSVRPRLAQSM